MRKLVIIGALLIFAVVFAFAGGGAEEEKGSATEATTGKPVTIAISWVNNDPLWQGGEMYLEKVIEEYTAKTGRKIKMQTVAAMYDTERQVNQIEQMITQKPDVIVCSPVDSKQIATSIKASQDAGIPFVCFMRSQAPDVLPRADSDIGADGAQEGYNAAMALFGRMEKDGVEPVILELVGDLTDENAVLRQKGHRKALAERGYSVIQEVPTNWNPDECTSNLSTAMTAHPDVNCILSGSDYLLQGTKAALERVDRWKKYGEEGHVYQSVVDVYPAGWKGIMDGYVDVGVAFDIYEIAKKGLEVMVDLADGIKPANPVILVGGRTVTMENADTLPNLFGKDFYEELK